MFVRTSSITMRQDRLEVGHVIRQARHPTFEFEVIAARGNKLLLKAAGAVESNST